MAKATKPTKTARKKTQKQEITEQPSASPEPKNLELADTVEKPKESPEVDQDKKPPQEEPETEAPIEAAPTIIEKFPAKPVEIITVEKNAFLPVFLGGVVAAVLGFTAAKTQILDPFLPTDWQVARASDVESVAAQVSAQSQEFTTLSDRVSGLVMPDLTATAVEIAHNRDVLSEVQTRLDRFSADLATLGTRLTDLEKRPISEGVSQSAITAYERELQALQDSVSVQRSEIESLLTDARAMEKNAEMSAQDALARAALTRVLSAIDSGGPFEAALNDLISVTGAEVPKELSAVARKGVMPLVQLQDQFPDAARVALNAARLEEPDAENSIGAFFRRQLGARSVEPKSGSDPDAVLSRAESALKEGRMNDALAEIETLPEVAKIAMAEWLSLAETRKVAQDAAETLAQNLNTN